MFNKKKTSTNQIRAKHAKNDVCYAPVRNRVNNKIDTSFVGNVGKHSLDNIDQNLEKPNDDLNFKNHINNDDSLRFNSVDDLLDLVDKDSNKSRSNSKFKKAFAELEPDNNDTQILQNTNDLFNNVDSGPSSSHYFSNDFKFKDIGASEVNNTENPQIENIDNNTQSISEENKFGQDKKTSIEQTIVVDNELSDNKIEKDQYNKHCDCAIKKNLDNKDFSLDDELVELEFDEDSVAYYIVDDNDKEIGVCLYEDGKQVEYMYESPEKITDDLAQQSDVVKSAVEKVESLSADLSNAKDELGQYKGDALGLAKDLKKARDELVKAYSELQSIIHPFKK